jgi:hypothetical protein
VKSQKVEAGGQKVEKGSSKNWNPGIVIPQKMECRPKTGSLEQREIKKWNQELPLFGLLVPLYI